MITLSELLKALDIEQYTGPDPLSVQVGAMRFDSAASEKFGRTRHNVVCVPARMTARGRGAYRGQDEGGV